MAIAAVPEAETRLCGNCEKDIPVVNFIMHEIHCRRNIQVCCFCSESIPKSEMKNHIESEHVQVTCKCQVKIEKSLLKEHEASACPLRPATCQYCNIQLAFNKLQDHEVYCGARTETCSGCGRNIMVKDLAEHPRVCGQEVEQVRGRRAVPRLGDEGADLHALRDLRNQLRSEDKLKQLERKENTRSSLYEEWNADLDYVLALSLQSENSPHSNAEAEIPGDFWDNYYTKESAPLACLNETDKSNIFSCDSLVSFNTSVQKKNDEIVMLPCEFCEELYPAEDLILHQTGCNPASAFASFSKRSSLNPRGYDGLHAIGPKNFSSLSSSHPRAVQAEGNIMIPCEFCGIQIEEEVLFHHQDVLRIRDGSRGAMIRLVCKPCQGHLKHHCDLRPASPATTFPPPQLLSPQANSGRRDSPELVRRRIRHQGDVSPWCAGGFGQQRPSCAVGGTPAPRNSANARSAPSCFSGRASDAPDARGKPRSRAGGEGRLKNRGASQPVGGMMMPRARPTQNSGSEAFTSSFSRAAPTQPSAGTGGGRSLGMSDVPAGFRRRNTKAKAQSRVSEEPEKGTTT